MLTSKKFSDEVADIPVLRPFQVKNRKLISLGLQADNYFAFVECYTPTIFEFKNLFHLFMSLHFPVVTRTLPSTSLTDLLTTMAIEN